MATRKENLAVAVKSKESFKAYLQVPGIIENSEEEGRFLWSNEGWNSMPKFSMFVLLIVLRPPASSSREAQLDVQDLFVPLLWLGNGQLDPRIDYDRHWPQLVAIDLGHPRWPAD